MNPGTGAHRAATRPARAAALLAPLVIYVALAVLLSLDAWTDPGTRWIGGCCDPQQQMWFLAWIPYVLAHGVDPWITYQMNAPEGVNVMWNTNITSLSLLMAPVTLALGPVAAYNVAIVLAIGASGWICFLALRRFVASTSAAVIGGLLYAFSPYVASHAVMHLNLTAAWAPPLMLALLDELWVRGRRPPVALGAAIGLVAAIQLLTTEELLATMAVVGAILGVILAAVAHDRALVRVAVERTLRAALPALVVFLLIAAWPLAAQFLGPQQIHGRVQDVEAFSTDLLNLVLPTDYQLIAPDAATLVSNQFSGLYHEATGYLGIPLLILLTAIVAAWWRDLVVRVAGLMALITFVLSLGPALVIGAESTGWPLPWWPFAQLPLLEHVLPGRLTLFTWLAVAVIVARTIDRSLAAGWRRATPRLTALGVALAVCMPAPLPSFTTEVPAYFRDYDEHALPADSLVLVAPWFTNGGGADGMLWAAVTGNRLRMYEGYAYVPADDGTPRYGPAATQLSAIMEAIQDRGQVIVARGDVREQVARDLEATGITHVLVGPHRHREQLLAFFTDLFGRPAEHVDGVDLWRDVDEAGVVRTEE